MQSRHVIAGLMLGVQLFLPSSHADEIEDAAADGAGFANDIFPDAAVGADGSLNIEGLGAEGDISPEELFPDADPDAAQNAPDIGSEDEGRAAGLRAREQGSDAIDVLNSTNALEREDDFGSDPFLSTTDQIFNDIDQVADEFGACTTKRRAVPVQSTATIPEQRFCERIRKVGGSCTLTHELRVDPATNTVVVDSWGPADCLVAASHAVGPSVCTGDVTLLKGAAPGDCLTVDGVTMCPGDPLYEQLTPPPFDGKEQLVSRLAQTVEIGPLDCESNITALPCITTSTGEEICPTDDGETIDTCGGLRNDPSCLFVSEGCVAGAEINGVCYLQETQFSCDQEIGFQTFEEQTRLSCPAGDIRCNGDTCVDVDRETNNGVTRGLAALTASQLLAFDSRCTSADPNSCDAYAGRPRACQRGIGGIFDSCELPTPLGPGPYLDLVFTIGSLDTNLTVLKPSSPFRGAWEKLRDPAVSAIDALETPFTSEINSVTGATDPNANDPLTDDELTATRQELANETADFALERYGAGATNTLFVGPGVEGNATDGTRRTGDVALREPPLDRSPLSLVADAYGVSAAETVPADPQPLVEIDDVEAAAHADAGNCIFVGTQCTPDSFGACISRDHVLCCFSSALGRLAQESAVEQFKRDFGTQEAPNCRGLTAAEIQSFDYTALNLDQWIAILGTADRFPDPEKLTPDGLTGSGNLLGRVQGQGARPDVITRTRSRLNGLDPGAVRARGAAELKTGQE